MMETSSLPTVAIVTPSLNKVPYLGQTIQSVISQEGAFRIEYFIMDGGSTDGSVDLIRSYADLVSGPHFECRCAGVSLHWVSQPDRGQTAAVNHGMRRASGDCVAFLNADDTYLPGAFSRVVEAFQSYPKADFIYGDGDVVDEEGRLQWEWLSRPYDYRLLSSYHFAWNAFPNYVMQQATFWRRSVLDRIGYLDESMHFAMDLEYWLRAGSRGLVLEHIPVKLASFRMIQGTKTLSSPTAFWEDQLEIFRRHHGAGAMRKYLRYYYFNLAIHAGSDLKAAAEQGVSAFEHWRGLPASEVRTLRRAAQAGLWDAGFLCAIQMHRDGRVEEARRLYTETVRSCGALNVRRLWCLVRLAVGKRAGSWLDSLWQAPVREYRRRRIDYRYQGARQ
jgi:glycosyltransferase involved in cell wall biosynthesis